MKRIICLLTLFFCFTIHAQYGKRDSNQIGISAGITQMDLFSEQFNAKPEMGWTAGFSLRGNYYNIKIVGCQKNNYYRMFLVFLLKLVSYCNSNPPTKL